MRLSPFTHARNLVVRAVLADIIDFTEKKIQEIRDLEIQFDKFLHKFLAHKTSHITVHDHESKDGRLQASTRGYSLLGSPR